MNQIKALTLAALTATAISPGAAMAYDDPFDRFMRSIIHGNGVFNEPRRDRRVWRNDDDDDDDGRRKSRHGIYRGYHDDDDDDDGRRRGRNDDDDD